VKGCYETAAAEASVRIFSHELPSEGSLPCSQKSAIIACSVPDKSS
jgi:hypothetical protein